MRFHKVENGLVSKRCPIFSYILLEIGIHGGHRDLYPLISKSKLDFFRFEKTISGGIHCVTVIVYIPLEGFRVSCTGIIRCNSCKLGH